MDTEGQTTLEHGRALDVTTPKAIELKLEGMFGTVGEDGAGICW
jgi:hypothetical protein